ncbi:exonuclease SbcCD subunit D (plasmid) [Bradyrhizobium septentrionale]|uniref:Nuclease SbcCD subunit D n=1 Tax=Bradyrhizobium septentrionale TaxID=1404411 RepID=A0A973WAP7_9BRAD|nr:MULTISPECIES: exonuclease SbcCD subunit D [Bradyrhizobium]MCK7664885.1 exonuclease SbcCD subunit D [Bradyrhizobium sp. 2S1]UGY20970.1 exonuclease SbcCD subunit D [Bradyrhizobium septentrionale]
MIRILHTADWHLGQMLRGFSREHEHRRVFEGLEAIVVEHDVDALIIAGDVFENQNPSGEAQRLFYDTLVRLSRARPRMTTVIVAGNHDAAGRLEAPRPLLEAFNIRVVGNVRRPNGRIEASRHCVPITDETGAVAAHVLAVSYPTAACLPNLTRLDGEAGSPIVAGVRSLYSELLDTLRPQMDGLPFIATGHLHVAGGIESEGAERRILVGGQHAVPHDVFPVEASYVALGHLHKAQAVGRDSVRYSGSLIPLSATEQPYHHGVTLVKLDGAQAVSEDIPISRPVPFLRLPEAGDMHLNELGDYLSALDLQPDLAMDERPFVQIRIAREGLSPGFREEIDRIAESFPVRIVDVRVTAMPDELNKAVIADPLIRLADRDPEDVFKLAFERAFGVAPEAAHLEVFHRARAEA